MGFSSWPIEQVGAEQCTRHFLGLAWALHRDALDVYDSFWRFQGNHAAAALPVYCLRLPLAGNTQ